MAGGIDYTDWLDGEPILQTTDARDGSFTAWIDGEPLIMYGTILATQDFEDSHEGRPVVDTIDTAGDFEDAHEGRPVIGTTTVEEKMVLADLDAFHLHDADNVLLNALFPDNSYHLHDVDSVLPYSYTGTLQITGLGDYLLHDVPDLGFVYHTDFSEYSTGPQPSDWTERWYTNFTETYVQESSNDWVPGKMLYNDNRGSGDHLITWDALDSIHADVEILALVYTPYLNQGVTRIYARASGGYGAEYGYYLSFNGDNIVIVKHENSVKTAISDAFPSALEDSRHYWFRFRVVGNELKGKIWYYTHVEPEDWQVEVTDDTISDAGWSGIGTYVGGGDNWVYYYALATNGSTPAVEVSGVPDPVYYGPQHVGNNWDNYNIDEVRVWGMNPPENGYVYGWELWQTDDYGDFRMALYSGGDLSTGPDGATLLYDSGVVGKVSDWWDDAWMKTRFGPALQIPMDAPLWVALKGDGSYYTKLNTHDGDYGNWDPAGFRSSTAVNRAESVAWAGTWPSDTGSFATTWPALRLHIERIPYELVVDEAYHLHDADAPVLTPFYLVVDDAYHFHDADAIGWLVETTSVWSDSHGVYDSNTKSVRVVLSAADIADPGFDVSKVRVRFDGSPLFGYKITGASIGIRSGSTEDYEPGTVVRLTFDGGSHTRDNCHSPDFYSDWVAFPDFDETKDMLVHIDMDESTGWGVNVYFRMTASGGTSYRLAGVNSDAMVEDISGYTQSTTIYIVEELQVKEFDGTLTDLDTDHLHDADPLTLTQDHSLVVEECFHLHDADNVPQAHALVVAESYHDLIDEGPITITTGGAITLIIPDAFHLHDGETFALTQDHTLVVAEAFHLHDGEAIVLAQDHALAVAEAYHLHDADNITLVTDNTLTVSECNHLVVDDPVSLTQDHDLVVAECHHEHFGDNTILTEIIDLVVNACDNLQEADNITLTALHILTVAECYHAHAGPNLDMTTTGALNVAEAFHLHDSENITLTYSSTLANLDTFHLHDADASILECGQALDIFVASGTKDDTDWWSTSRNERMWYDIAKHAFPNQTLCRVQIVAQPSYDLTITNMSIGARLGEVEFGDDFSDDPVIIKFDGSQGCTVPADGYKWSNWTSYTVADSPTEHILFNCYFNADHRLSSWGNNNAQQYRTFTDIDYCLTKVVSFSSSNTERYIWKIQVKPPTITSLSINGDDLLHYADTIPTLNKVIDTVNEAYHLHDADLIPITQVHELAVDEAHHLHFADTLALTVHLVVAEAYHEHYADTFGLEQVTYLTVDEAYHLLVTDPVALTQDHSLIVEECYHLHYGDAFPLSGTGELGVYGADHLHFVDDFALTQEHTLAVDESTHLHFVDNVDLVWSADTVVAESDHLHSVDNVDLTQEHSLAVEESSHVVDSDTFWIFQVFSLAVDESAHLVASDNITLTGLHILDVQECGHILIADDYLGLTQEHYLRMADSHIVHLHYADNIWIVALPVGGVAGMGSLTPVRTLKSLTNRRSLNSLSLDRTVNSLSSRRSLNSLTAKRRLAA